MIHVKYYKAMEDGSIHVRRVKCAPNPGYQVPKGQQRSPTVREADGIMLHDGYTRKKPAVLKPHTNLQKVDDVAKL